MKPYGIIPSYVRGYIRRGKRKHRATCDCADTNNQIKAVFGRRAREKRIAKKEMRAQINQWWV